MTDTKCDMTLQMGWPTLHNGEALRRNTTGFGAIKELVAKSSNDKPLAINAFLYAFLVSAKNLDLFLKVDINPIKPEIQEICQKMNALAELEREGNKLDDDDLLIQYKKVRLMATRSNARDEHRTLATLLFSGPSTPDQISEDLGINTNLAERILRALSTLVEPMKEKSNSFVLRKDPNSIAITLYILQYTLGLDPLRVLQSHAKNTH